MTSASVAWPEAENTVVRIKFILVLDRKLPHVN